MHALAFDVPPTFWSDLKSTSLHFRRVTPGEFDSIPTEMAETFLSGRGSLPLARGWNEFLEVQLNFKTTVEGTLGIQPRVHLRRILLDNFGRADCAAMEANFALPDDERRAKHGWWLNDEEAAQVRAAMEVLIESRDDAAWNMVELFVGPNALLSDLLGPNLEWRCGRNPRARDGRPQEKR